MQVSPTGEVTKRFTLQQVFTYERDIRIGGVPAKGFLMLHAISSLYLEGLIPPGVLIASYPSHKAGESEGLLDDWLAPAATMFHGWYKRDLLVRAVDASDTSLLRVQGDPVDPEMQMATVHVNPTYKSLLRDRTVVLLDDFTTDGNSLEWGKNLLQAAGVARVILMTIGKYGRNHPLFHKTLSPKPGVKLAPFEVSNRPFDDVFQLSWSRFTLDVSATRLLEDSLTHLAQGQALPVRTQT